ncbi:Dihydroneopterin aldolase [Candidatus Trichorickettsia mobilis]|uniref:dihydroneopterin aldolase n=1 Tax=Candidatus Trichorickettsia mobilis TaxID=1346319 RepID=A0ABZ0UQ32_9RICK|nr:dihydroneopterin aldolase [Candidatus Trichorickettsia mobilis]WPY00154.1 Dihydroneopterin aldolase [Candidatus Trichorickettsia mobilis]
MSDQINLPKLKITDLRLWVHLGCSAEERSNPQAVSISAHFVFPVAPKGAYTDLISDSICYRRAVELIKEAVEGKEFNLIEHLAVRVYDALFSYINEVGYNNLKIKVVATKISPPIPGLYGGVSFSYSGKQH